MKKIKLLTAPYKFYNQFMPPTGFCIVSQNLHDNNIDHDKDDLYVKLHHLQKKGEINLNLTNDEIVEWQEYILGKDNKDVESVVAKIAGLTNFEGYDLLLFSVGHPTSENIPTNLITHSLFRFLKNKYNPIIITNNLGMGGKDLGLVDEIIPMGNDLLKYLKEKMKFEIKSNFKIGTKQNLEGLPLELYKHHGLIVAGYYFYEGCPYRCYFCDGFFTQKRKNYTRHITLPNPETIVKEIKGFVGKYGITNLMFHNTTLNITEKFASDIAKNMIKSNLDIMWSDCATFKGMTFELLDLLKKSGCTRLVFGLETASKTLQKKINKEVDLNHATKVLKHCYDIGIWAEVTLLCGLPYQSYKDLYETLVFLRDNYKYIRGMNLNRFVIKPMSEFYYNSKEHGLTIKKVDSIFTTTGFDEANGMDWEEKSKYTQKVYEEILDAIDPARVDYLRPVNQVFKIFSNKLPIPLINKYLNSNVLNNDTSKLNQLIEKYKGIISEEEIKESCN